MDNETELKKSILSEGVRSKQGERITNFLWGGRISLPIYTRISSRSKNKIFHSVTSTDRPHKSAAPATTDYHHTIGVELERVKNPQMTATE
jgi:hypothetical protein